MVKNAPKNELTTTLGFYSTPVEAEVQERDLGRRPENVKKAEVVTVATEDTI
jgi:hypothetical protein